MVAPHAHHYFPKADHVGVQYPPGTGILLASFREGKALQGLNRNVVLIFLAVGVLALVIAGVKQTWAAAGCMIFAMEFGLYTLEHIGALSFSINALFAPLLFALIFLCASLRIGATATNPLLARSVAFLAGLCFGFSILVRLPVIFLLPGLLLLFIPLSGRPHLKGTAFAFAAGILLCGILPLLIHQHRLAGAWYLPTYNSGDNSLPTLEVIKANLDFYLGLGLGSRGLWYLPVAFLGFIGLAVLRRHSRPGIGFSWGRVAGAALLLWGVSLAYFLSHRITISYYQIPATFSAIVLLMVGAFTIECFGIERKSDGEVVGKGRQILLLCLAFLPGIVALTPIWTAISRTTPYEQKAKSRPIVMPEPLADKRAWIFADVLTGPIWFYAQRPAYKIAFSDPATRRLVYRFIAARGEPQYVICDNPAMQPMLDEIEQMGGTLEETGTIENTPYYLIHWPEVGAKSDTGTALRP